MSLLTIHIVPASLGGEYRRQFERLPGLRFCTADKRQTSAHAVPQACIINMALVGWMRFQDTQPLEARSFAILVHLSRHLPCSTRLIAPGVANSDMVVSRLTNSDRQTGTSWSCTCNAVRTRIPDDYRTDRDTIFCRSQGIY